MTGIQAYDGETGWMVMPFMGKTDPEEDVRPTSSTTVKEQSDMVEGPLINYADRERTHQVELVGKEEIEGTEAYKIKLTRRRTGDVRLHTISTPSTSSRSSSREQAHDFQGTERRGRVRTSVITKRSPA